ncbi:YaaC family protein [Robertmurraya siralis]|uniref:YaaC family protein n=1 Tax=Robertmurraya siralis TaxID=77777 RepID=UPI0010F4F901|nr:YaaC family protein [Robertmurraya siralis]
MLSHWSSFSLFFSASYTQQYLKNIYEQNKIDNAEQKAYENCYPFIYYLEHGKVYYEQGKHSPLIIQPILLFYGLIHLIKACILTVDPNYPETTSVLAHGVSARKRKKQHFHFFQDEVKFQKTGLFPFLANKLFHMEHLEGDKISMGNLFKQVPELNSLLLFLDGVPSFTNVYHEGNRFFIPKRVLDFFHMTENRFLDFFSEKAVEEYHFKRLENGFIVFEKNEKKGDFNYTPLKYNLAEQTYALPLTKENGFVFHELLVHYLLLYNLSMIARYETEWWSELAKTMPNKDFPLIETFLQVSIEKGPFLVYEYLTKAGH